MLGILMFLSAAFNTSALTVDLTTVPEVHATTTQELMTIATSNATYYHLTKKQTTKMMAVIKCESNWNNETVGPYGELGLVQIYLKYHPQISKEQALNPYFALDFISRQFSVKNYSLWACYDILYPS